MAFGFGMPGVTPPSPGDDNALDPQLAALLRAHLEQTGGGAGLLSGPAPAAPVQGVGTANPRAPFGLYAPAQPGTDDDGPAATPPGYSGFTPSPTPTGGATPVVSTSGLPSIGSVLHGMTSGATQTGDTLTDLGSHIGSALGDMAGRSKDLIGRMQSGEISPGQFLSGAVSHARDAAMAGPNFTRDFLTGKIDPGSEEAAGGAFQAAATAMTGSLPFGVPAGALRTFGGRAAVTADHAALDRAAAMQAAGASPESIWQGTGWGLGRDGVARFEIPDDAARLLPQTGASATTLGSVLDHPALFDAYPAMRDVSVFNRPELGANAAANPSKNWIALNLSDPQALESLLHEGQHIVQRTEGFAPGASPIDPALAAHPQVAEVAALRQRLAGIDNPQAAALADRADQSARMGAYRTAAGEVEARNVEARQGMTPAERTATPPWQTQDVPSDRQWLPPQSQGSAVTGDAAQMKLGAEPPPQSLDDLLASMGSAIANHAPEAPPPGPRRVDPSAASWDLYHGSTPGPDFQRFDPSFANNPAERGGVFFAPDPETAASYAGRPKEGAEAGSRVYRATVDPGRTDVFDIAHLAETDPAFNARARAITAGQNPANAPFFDSYMDTFLANRAQDKDIARQAAEMGFTVGPDAATPLSFGHGHMAAAIERAQAQGLDTAIIRGVSEHGGDDQVIALTPGRVRSAYAPDQLLYGAAGLGAGTAAFGLGGPSQAQAASGSYSDRVVGAESGGNATAKNPNSSATGAGQFISGTWLDMMKRYRPDLANSLPKDQLLALRNDPALSKEMVQHYGEENGAKLRASGLPDTDATRYLSHVTGPKGAKALLTADRSTPAAQVLDAAQVAANPFMKNMTAGQLTDWAAQKVSGNAPKMTMPGGSSGPGRFGLSGPTQAPFGLVGPSGAVAPVAASTSSEIDALLAQLAKSKGSGTGGLGFASGSSSSDAPKAPALTPCQVQRRPFGFMTFAGQRPRPTTHQPLTRRPA